MDGSGDVKVDWEKGRAWVTYDSDRTSPEDLVDAVNEKTPFEATLAR